MTVTRTLGTRVSCNNSNALAPSMSGLTIGDTIIVPWVLSRGDTAGTALSPPSGWSAAENPAAPAGGSGNYQPICGIFFKTVASTTETCTIPSIPGGSYGYADILSAHSTLGTLVLSTAHTSLGNNTNATSGNTGTTASVSGTENIAIAVIHPEDQVGNITAMTFPPTTSYVDIGHDQANSTINAYCSGSKIGVTGTQQGAATWTTSAKCIGSIAVFEVAGASGITGAGQIASGEAIGAPGIGATVAPAGIASAQALGTPGVGASIAAVGIASAEQFGQPAIGAGIAPAGIASAQALGAPAVAAVISTVGIASAEAVGAPVVNGAGIFASGIASAEAFGQPALAAGISSAAIGSGEAVGQPTVGTPASRNAGFELGPRFVSFKPLLQRILEARAERRVKPAKERAAKRAKIIEVQAAELVLQDDGAEARFRELMANWMAQRPVIPPVVAQVDPMQLFMAQVAFRIQQMQAEQQARARLAAQDEEEALIALLLA